MRRKNSKTATLKEDPTDKDSQKNLKSSDKDQKELLISFKNPYLQPKNLKDEDTHNANSEAYKQKKSQETEQQKAKRLAKNKISAAKSRQKKNAKKEDIKRKILEC